MHRTMLRYLHASISIYPEEPYKRNPIALTFATNGERLISAIQVYDSRFQLHEFTLLRGAASMLQSWSRAMQQAQKNAAQF
jgi:F0F1-type ATP synthase gamma subunit